MLQKEIKSIFVPPQEKRLVFTTKYRFQGLEYSQRLEGAVAQLVEQWTENPCVGGSIPPHTTQRFNPHGLNLFIFHTSDHKRLLPG